MVYTETIKLDDGVSGPAKQAAREVKVLSGALDTVNKSLIKAKALGNVDSVNKLTADAGKLKGALAQLPAASNAASSSMGGTSAASIGMQAELAAATGGLSLLVEAAGAAALAFGVVTLAGAAFAIKCTEAKNASLSLWSALGKGEITGAAVDDMLDDLRASTGLTKDSLGVLTEGFLRMGITGEESLRSLTIAAASAEAMAKGGGAAFTQLFQLVDTAAETGNKLVIPYKKLEKQLVSMGLNVNDLADQMGMSGEALTKGLKAGTVDARKFGAAMTDAITTKGVGPMQTLANSSANLGKILEEYLGDLFEDMAKDIAPFMKEVKGLFSILDSKANPSGMALKTGIGAFFKEVFAAATIAVPYIKHFLLDVVIYGLRAYIALKPIVKWFQDVQKNVWVVALFSAALRLASEAGATVVSWLQDMAANQAVMDTLKTTGIVLGVAFGAVALAVGFVVAGFVAFNLALMAAVVGIGAIILAIGTFTTEAAAKLGVWTKEAITFGSQFVDGLVQGITQSAGKAVAAVTNLAGQAKGAFTSAMGIKSPSTVMAEMGGHMTAGLAQGLDDGASEAHGAASRLAGSAVGGASETASGASKGASGANISVSVLIEGAGKSALEITEEMVSQVFARMALEAGV